MAPRPDSFRHDIEGLRGIAVLIVVLYHAGVPGFSGGFVGVDVFFVLSGYLITGLLIKEMESTGRLDLVRFYSRRARRLLPAAALVLFATVAVSHFVFSPLEQINLARSAFATATYLSNTWFAFLSADYFATSTETNPLLHTWSLSVEEQFYLVWPLLIMLGLQRSRSRVTLVALLSAVSLLSLVGSLWLTATHAAWAYYLSPVRAWEFGFGGLACLVAASSLRRRPEATRFVGWLGLLLIGAATCGFDENTRFPGTAALVPVIGTIAALVSGVGAPQAGIGRLLHAQPLQRIGQLSYSWYLWHWPVLVITLAILPGLGLAGRLICVALSLGLAWATYVLVENPVRFHPRLTSHPRRSLALAAVLTIIGAGVGLAWLSESRQLAASPLHRSFREAANDRPYAPGDCMSSWGESELTTCEFGDFASPNTVVLFGDSHAAQWYPAVAAASSWSGFRLVVLTKAACPSADVAVSHRNYRRADECVEWRTRAIAYITSLRPSLVVLGNASLFYFEKLPDGTDRPLPYETWRAGFASTFGALHEAGTSALVLWGNPRAPERLPECLSRAAVQHWNRNLHCAFDRRTALDPDLYRAARDVAQGLNHVVVADLSSYFCGESVCEPIHNGAVVLHDRHHLTATRAAALAPVVSEYMRGMIFANEGLNRDTSPR